MEKLERVGFEAAVPATSLKKRTDTTRKSGTFAE